MTVRLLAITVAAAMVLAGCAEADPGEEGPVTGAPTRSSAATTTSPDRSSAAATATESPSAITQPSPQPVLSPLTWQPVGRSVQEEVTAGGGWTVVVDRERSLATLSGPAGTRTRTVSGDKRFRVSTVLLDGRRAVVVLGDTLQQRPARVTVFDLEAGGQQVLDGGSDLPTVNGGTWGLHGDVLVHATRANAGDYCLATRDVRSTGLIPTGVAHCAPARHGFTNARLSPAGIGLLTFDDSRPSCRTLGIVGAQGLTPVEGPAACKGWEVVPTDTGVVWSEIPREKALDEAHVYAVAPDGAPADLGPATSGSLTWCAGATYFVRDPQAPGEPARLLRWTDSGAFEIVYQTPPGAQAFLDGPRCGGDRITISAYAESGDQQVSAALP